MREINPLIPRHSRGGARLCHTSRSCWRISQMSKTQSDSSAINNQVRFPCINCTRSFKNPNGLMSHNENKHDQLEVFCPKCFNAFTNENAFEQHRTECSHQVHPSERPFRH